MIKSFLTGLFVSTSAFAQGFLNPPIYATGVINVQPGTTVTTVVRNAVSPNNINVLAQGAITTWNIKLPFPSFDGQLISISCPGGAVGTLSVTSNGSDAVSAASVTSCTSSTNQALTYQYSATLQTWYPLTVTGTTSANLTGTSLAINASWPSSFGSIPTFPAYLNVGNYPSDSYIPLGVMGGLSSAVAVPVGQTQSPWPHTAVSAYIMDAPSVAGGTSVGVFTLASLSRNTSGNLWGLNTVTRNMKGLAVAADGQGYDFDTLYGIEIDMDFVKNHSNATPTGNGYGLVFIGGSTVKPSGTVTAAIVSPLGTNVKWDNGFVISDNSVTTGMFLGATSGAAANVASVPLYFRGYNGASASVLAFMNIATNQRFRITTPSNIVESYASINGTAYNFIARNDNGGSPLASIGFDVTTGGETTVPKGGVGFIRQNSQGAGLLGLFNRISTDTNGFGLSDAVLTWDLNNAMQFNSSAQWTANGAVATTMTSLGPTGSHTTIQEWFVVKNASGTVRYIPAY